MLGRAWMKEYNTAGNASEVWGAGPTAAIVRMGLRLASLDGLAGTDDLITRIKRKDVSALAELTAIHLLRRCLPSAAVELGPDITVGSGPRKPDFRVRERPSDPWTYVEVTQPDISDTEERLRAVMARLTAVVKEVKRSFGLELFLRREPTDDEVEALTTRARGLARAEGGAMIREELPDRLGLLLLNQSGPGMVVLDDHDEPHVPRIAQTETIFGGTEPHRHIAVRLAYSDERAERFLGREARQLPKDAPGLIVISMGHAPGGFKSWEPLVLRRFGRKLHTRVGAVCLLGGGSILTPEGEKLLPQTKVLVNPHAVMPLPLWMVECLVKAGEEYQHYMSPAAPSSRA